MIRNQIRGLGAVAVFGALAALGETGMAQPESAAEPTYVLDFEMNRIDGSPEKLSSYEGKVILIVNVASECGLTPQYEQLQALFEERSDDGLVILGFPANDFGAQEPGTNQEIQEFCTSNFGVTFPMFEKISVKGDDQHALYTVLTSQPEPIGGDPEWNFTKFLVDREGRVVKRFGPRTAPNDAEFVEAINVLLDASG